VAVLRGNGRAVSVSFLATTDSADRRCLALHFWI